MTIHYADHPIRADHFAEPTVDEPRALMPSTTHGSVFILAERTDPFYQTLSRQLALEGYNAQIDSDLGFIRNSLAIEHYDILLVDIGSLGKQKFEWLLEMQNRIHNTELVVVTEHGVVDTVVKLMRLGAYSVLVKPFKVQRLLIEFDRIVQQSEHQLAGDPIVKYLYRHLAEDNLRQQVADHFGISPDTISKRVKERTALSFSDFITRCRIDEAQRLLKYTNLNVNQVATRAGFNSPQAFCRCFRKNTKRTALQFRLQARMA